MSMDRYFTIRYPIKYGRNRTKTMVGLKITFAWFISITICIALPIKGFTNYDNVYNDGQCVPLMSEFVIVGSIFAFYLPLFIMVVTHCLTVRILNKNILATIGERPASQSQATDPAGRNGGGKKRAVEGIMRQAHIAVLAALTVLGGDGTSGNTITSAGVPSIRDSTSDEKDQQASSSTLPPPLPSYFDFDASGVTDSATPLLRSNRVHHHHRQRNSPPEGGECLANGDCSLTNVKIKSDTSTSSTSHKFRSDVSPTSQSSHNNASSKKRTLPTLRRLDLNSLANDVLVITPSTLFLVSDGCSTGTSPHQATDRSPRAGRFPPTAVNDANLDSETNAAAALVVTGQELLLRENQRTSDSPRSMCEAIACDPEYQYSVVVNTNAFESARNDCGQSSLDKRRPDGDTYSLQSLPKPEDDRLRKVCCTTCDHGNEEGGMSGTPNHNHNCNVIELYDNINNYYRINKNYLTPISREDSSSDCRILNNFNQDFKKIASLDKIAPAVTAVNWYEIRPSSIDGHNKKQTPRDYIVCKHTPDKTIPCDYIVSKHSEDKNADVRLNIYNSVVRGPPCVCSLDIVTLCADIRRNTDDARGEDQSHCRSSERRPKNCESCQSNSDEHSKYNNGVHLTGSPHVPSSHDDHRIHVSNGPLSQLSQQRRQLLHSRHFKLQQPRMMHQKDLSPPTKHAFQKITSASPAVNSCETDESECGQITGQHLPVNPASTMICDAGFGNQDYASDEDDVFEEDKTLNSGNLPKIPCSSEQTNDSVDIGTEKYRANGNALRFSGTANSAGRLNKFARSSERVKRPSLVSSPRLFIPSRCTSLVTSFTKQTELDIGSPGQEEPDQNGRPRSSTMPENFQRPVKRATPYCATSAGPSTDLGSRASSCVSSGRKMTVQRQRGENERKASKVLGIIFAVFVILWLPFFIINVLSAVCEQCVASMTSPVVASFVWLGYMSSLANPIIYTMFSTSFRTVFFRIVTCQYYTCLGKTRTKE